MAQNDRSTRCLYIVCAAFSCDAQSHVAHTNDDWTRTWGSDQADFATALAASQDPAVRYHVAGALYGDDPELGDATWNALGGNGHTALLTLDERGLPVRGARLDGTTVASRPRVVVDAQGAVYLAALGAPVELETGAGAPRRFEQQGYVVRFGADGERTWRYDWPVAASSVELATQPSLALASNGDLLLSAMREEPAVSFAARLRARDGSEVWSTRMSGAQRAVAASGDAVYIYGGVQVGNDINAWLRKLDADGQELWTKTWGDALTHYGVRSPAGGPEPAADLQALPDGGVLVAASYRSLGTAVSGQQGSSVLPARGGTEAFVAAFTRDGERRWMVHWGGDGNDSASSIAFQEEGTLIVAGWFEDWATMPDDSRLTGAGLDAFVLAISPDGDYIGARSLGGSGEDLAYGVHALSDGSLSVAGSFQDRVDFGSRTEHDVRSAQGHSDAFLTHFRAADYGLASR